MNRRFLASLAALAVVLGAAGLAAVAGEPVATRGAEPAAATAANAANATNAARSGGTPSAAPGAPPRSLRDTGLYSDWAGKSVARENLAYAPQYPLWTDGATKRRWLHVPPGAAIDGSSPDAWVFPVGTRLWKEFAFGRRVETRYMERTAQGWTYATYVWNAAESEAWLAPARGLPSSVEVAPGKSHAIPGDVECRACHDAVKPVLGVSALQLSPDRDPGALHADVPPGAVDLPGLVRAGLIRGVPEALLRTPPRIRARSATERAALGYLEGNCGGCHDSRGSLASLGMWLAYSLAPDGASAPPAIATTFGRPSRFVPWGLEGDSPAVRVAPGEPERSVLLARLRSRDPAVQMPPLGSHVVDREAVALFERWITEAPALPEPLRR